MKTTESDVEAIKAALRAYRSTLGTPCPSCGAVPGSRCTTVGGTAQRRLDVPHRTRVEAAKAVAR